MIFNEGVLNNVARTNLQQLFGQFIDAKAARESYVNALSIADMHKMVVVENEEVIGGVLYKEMDGQVKVHSALIASRVDRNNVMAELITYFSKLRMQSVELQVLFTSDQKWLERFEFKYSENDTMRRTFVYPVAFVFGGGGAHGAFLTGAYEALAENGIIPSMLYGVSVGAITGMSLMHLDTTIANATWAELTTDMVYEVDEVSLSRLQFTKNLTKNFITRHYYNKDSLRRVIEPAVAHELATPALADFTLIATEFPTMKETAYRVTEQTTVAELTDWILASSAFYPLVSPVEIAGKRYIDGGYSNNVPANLAAADGAKEIFAFSIMDNKLMNLNVPDDVNLHFIRTPWELGPLLDFIPEASHRHQQLGQLRTRQVLGQYGGYYYAFNEQINVEWLGGVQLIRWLSTDPVTAPIADLLNNAPMWLLWMQWLESKSEGKFAGDRQAIGLATIERLGVLLDVDPTKVYSLQSFIDEIVAHGYLRNQLPLPKGRISRPYLAANMAVVLTGVLYLLSKSAKQGRI